MKHQAIESEAAKDKEEQRGDAQGRKRAGGKPTAEPKGNNDKILSGLLAARSGRVTHQGTAKGTLHGTRRRAHSAASLIGKSSGT